MEWHLDVKGSKKYVDEAITEYQIALESYIESAEIYFKIGNAFYLKRELDKAKREKEQRKNQQPGNHGTYPVQALLRQRLWPQIGGNKE